MIPYLFILPFLLIAGYSTVGTFPVFDVSSLQNGEILNLMAKWAYYAVVVFCWIVCIIQAGLIVVYYVLEAISMKITDWTEMLRQANVPEDKIEEALKSLEEGKKLDSRVVIYSLTAPLVMFFVLPFVKWKAENMPKLFWQWDNNINMNGDRRTYQDSTVTYYHWGDKKMVTDNRWQDHDLKSERAIANCYWAKGHHPRSFWARWIWLGTRNRAKAFHQSMSKDVDLSKEQVIYGTIYDGKNDNIAARFSNGLWQLHGNRTIVFKFLKWNFKIRLVQNFGYKINNAFVEQKTGAMPVYVSGSYKDWEITKI